MQTLHNIINAINDVLWGYVLIYLLLAVGIYFTLRLGFVQIRHFREMFRCLLGFLEPKRGSVVR